MTDFCIKAYKYGKDVPSLYFCSKVYAVDTKYERFLVHNGSEFEWVRINDCDLYYGFEEED